MKLFSRFSTNPRWLLFLFIGLVLIAAISRTSPKGENKLLDINNGGESQKMRAKSKGGDYPPVLAYWVSGSSGDVKRMLRLLKAIYHPRNCYLLGFDAAATESERSELAFAIQSDGVFKGFGNVDVVGKSFAVDEMGCSGLSVTLHAAALLLKLSRDWDWFVPLSSSDYPLVSQDDLLHALTPLPRELNFIDYSNNNGWKDAGE